MSEAVRYDRVGPVAWITIDRPEARNAINAAVRDGLREATARFNDDDAAVLVLTGSGDVAFCAGADLKEMSAQRTRGAAARLRAGLRADRRVDKPTIAAVNGVALAGGFLLAQMCDLCVAADHARFAISEVRVGRGAPWAAPLPWLVPPRVAMELLVTGEPMTGPAGLRGGARQPRRPDGRAARRGPGARRGHRVERPAVGRCRRSAPSTSRWPPPTRRPRRIWEPVYRSADAQEGPRAFAEKRPPRWQGR